MLSAGTKLGLTCHGVDLLAHFVESAIDPLTLKLDIISHHLVDGHARLVEHSHTTAKPFDQRQAS